MPDGLYHFGFNEVVGGVFSDEFLSRFKEVAEVFFAEPFLIEAFEGFDVMEFSKSIVEREVEGGEADKGGEVRHLRGFGKVGIFFIETRVQMVFDVVVSNDHRVAVEGVGYKVGTKHFREGLQPVLAFLVAEIRWPDPSDTEWSFGPTGGGAASGFGMNGHACA